MMTIKLSRASTGSNPNVLNDTTSGAARAMEWRFCIALDNFLSKNVSLIRSSGCQDQTRIRICEAGLKAPQARKSPEAETNRTVSPGNGELSILSIAPAKIQGCRRRSDFSLPGFSRTVITDRLEDSNQLACIIDDVHGVVNFFRFMGSSDRGTQPSEARWNRW